MATEKVIVIRDDGILAEKQIDLGSGGIRTVPIVEYDDNHEIRFVHDDNGSLIFSSYIEEQI